jgi:hypothetical protein
MAIRFQDEAKAESPTRTVEQLIRSEYQRIAKEPDSIFTALVSYECEDRNSPTETDYLRGMLEPYFRFCRSEPATAWGRFKESVSRYAPPIEFEDLDPTFGRKDEAFLRNFYQQQLVHPKPPHEAQRDARIKFLVENFGTPARANDLILGLCEYLEDSSIRLTDGDLTYLIEHFPTDTDVTGTNAHNTLKAAVYYAKLGKFEKSGGLFADYDSEEPLDVVALWKAYQATRGPVHNQKEFEATLKRSQQIIDTIRKGERDTDFTRAIKALIFRHHQRIQDGDQYLK